MDRESLVNTLEMLKPKIETFENSIEPYIDIHEEQLNQLLGIIDSIEESWSGSWVGFHANLYYKDFTRPEWHERFNSEWGSLNAIPNCWIEIDYKDIVSYIKTKYNGADIEDINKTFNTLIKTAKTMKDTLCTELSRIKHLPNLEEENVLLEEIEKIKWGFDIAEFIEYRQPKQIMTRDTFALSQGIKNPPHIVYQAKALRLNSIISHFREFLDKSKKLIRLVEIRLDEKGDKKIAEDSIGKVTRICKNFHTIVKQLRNRHANRQTIEIEDEYDVQDLLHSLLKIFFDDIRPEEWTPSYAGGSSRMDFLIKDVNIVVEVKKTRENHTGKAIGDELIIDIAKYKEHPNCMILICFIYDPDGMINNPKGLVSDLSKLSDENIKVLVEINPA